MKRTSEWIVTVCVSLIAALLLPSLLLLLPQGMLSADVTENKLFSISETTEKFLGSLERDVTLYVLKPTHAKDFDRILEGFRDRSDYLHVQYVKESDTAEILSRLGATEADISEDSILIESDLRFAFLDHYGMYSYRLDDYELSLSEYAQYYEYAYQLYTQEQDSSYLEQLAQMNLVFEIEFQLLSAIEYVSEKYIPHPFILDGHGDKAKSEKGFGTLLETMGYDIGFVDLSSSELPLDCGELILFAPQNDLSADEKDKVRSYLADGGRLTVISDADESTMPNLASLLADYGLSQAKEAVEVPLATEESEEEPIEEPVPVYSTTFFPNLNQNDMALSYLISAGYGTQVTLDTVKPILIDETKLSASQLVTKLLTTSSDARLGANEGSYDCAIRSEQIENGKSSVILWFAGPDNYEISSGSASVQSYAPLIPLYESVTIARSFESKIGDITPKDMTETHLTVSETTKGFVVILLVFLVPAILLFLAWYVPFRRKKIA